MIGRSRDGLALRTLQGFAGSAAIWRSAKVSVASLVLACGIAGAAQAQNSNDWRPYFSEENDGATQCPASMGGVRCDGGWCDNVSVGCSVPGVIPTTEGSWGEWFSEERPNNKYTCPVGQMATGMKCKGANCDEIALHCAPTNVTVSNCRWTNWVSEERPGNEISFPNQIMTAMECRGGYCDEKRALICDYTKPTTVVGQPRGDWSVACSGGQGCTSAVTESLNIGGLDEKKWTSQTQLSLSSTIETGVSYGGVSASTSLTAGFQQTLAQAARIVKSTDRKYQRSCSQNLDFVKFDINTVWQYQITTPVAGTNVTVSTCTITCTPDGRKPNYAPGSPEDIGSCLRLRTGNRNVSTLSPATPASPAPATPAPAPNTPVIAVSAAHYGHNCPTPASGDNGSNTANTTRHVAAQCDGKANCDYRIDVNELGDPAPGCAKGYAVAFNCNVNGNTVDSGYLTAPAEAGLGSVVSLSCGPRLSVLQATYGANCGATPGNVTNRFKAACKRGSCNYTVDVAALGDPAPGCAKDFDVEYSCAGTSARRKIDAEANGKAVILACN